MQKVTIIKHIYDVFLKKCRANLMLITSDKIHKANETVNTSPRGAYARSVELLKQKPNRKLEKIELIPVLRYHLLERQEFSIY